MFHGFDTDMEKIIQAGYEPINLRPKLFFFQFAILSTESLVFTIFNYLFESPK